MSKSSFPEIAPRVFVETPSTKVETALCISSTYKHLVHPASDRDGTTQQADLTKQFSKTQQCCTSKQIQVNSTKRKFRGDEGYQRINYLYQASNLMLKLNPEAVKVSSFYGSIMRGVAKKCVLKLDVDLKRTLCKGCSCMLIPGQTARVRTSKKPSRCVLWTCLLCRRIKIFHTNKSSHLWRDNPNAWVE